jgi:hypothetical protein
MKPWISEIVVNELIENTPALLMVPPGVDPMDAAKEPTVMSAGRPVSTTYTAFAVPVKLRSTASAPPVFTANLFIAFLPASSEARRIRRRRQA